MNDLDRLPARFARKVCVNGRTGCWEWTGCLNGSRYAWAWCDEKAGLAHRYVYRLLVGPIPEGLQLDHLCRTRHCLNPAHLEPVTNYENQRRGERATKTHCIRGHEYTPENLWPDPNGHRHCKTCARIRDKRRKARVTRVVVVEHV